MSAPGDPSGSRELSATPAHEPTAVPGKPKRPWAWIAACVVLVALASGFAVWAVGLQSDLDEQQNKTTQAQQEADQAKLQAEEANEAVGALAGQLEQVTQGLDDAGDQLEQAGDDAQDTVDGLKGQVAALKDQLADAGDGTSTTPDPAEATATP
jgi:uncharacterized protein HemX